jgi:hypothetical protein
MQMYVMYDETSKLDEQASLKFGVARTQLKVITIFSLLQEPWDPGFIWMTDGSFGTTTTQSGSCF